MAVFAASISSLLWEFYKKFLPVATPKWSCYILYIFSEVVYICNKDSTIFKDFQGCRGLVCKEEKLWQKASIPIFFEVAEFTRMRNTKTW